MIINYNKYLTYTCKDLECLPLFESKGIPNTVKVFTNIIFNKLQKNVNDYIIDIDENDFKVKKLKITLKNTKSLKYYGSSGFGEFKDGSLIGSDIFIRFDFVCLFVSLGSCLGCYHRILCLSGKKND